MEEYGRKKRVCSDRLEEIEKLTNLPDALLCQILLNLPTKDAVKSSVLSHSWRNLWRYVPALDLNCLDFMVRKCTDSSDYYALVSFVDSFFGFNNESSLKKFRLKVNWYDDVRLDTNPYTWWFNTVVERKVQHLHVLQSTLGHHQVVIPQIVYTCESLVSLKLCDVGFVYPKFVSLPSVKVIELNGLVEFANDSAFEILISGCPVLESLTLCGSPIDIFFHEGIDFYCNNVKTYRVASQSLLSFVLVADAEDLLEDLEVVIDAPKLEYLRINDHRIASIILNNPASLVKADIDTMFRLSLENKFDLNDLSKRDMIRNFLVGISRVKDLIISSSTLEVIHDYSRSEPLPVFRNLSFLRVEFTNYRWAVLSIFLEICPNLKSLTLGFSTCTREGVSILYDSRRFLNSLEYVKIVKPMAEEATEKLVSYFLQNSTILKKLTLCLGNLREKEQFFILKKLITVPRFSSSCQVIVL